MINQVGFIPVSSNYTVTSSGTGWQFPRLAVTTGGSTITITLPVAGVMGVSVRKIDAGAGAIKLVTADGSQIDGVAGATGITTPAGVQHSGYTLENDGSNWWVTGT